MARYFFDTTNGDQDCDDVGLELADDKSALREALRYAGDLISDQPTLLSMQPDLFVRVRSEDGARVGAVRISVTDEP